MKGDKVILELSDPELVEYFSKKEEGEVCNFKFKLMLDEKSNGMATLSIMKTEILEYEDEREGDDDDDMPPSDEPEFDAQNPTLSVADEISDNEFSRTLY